MISHCEGEVGKSKLGKSTVPLIITHYKINLAHEMAVDRSHLHSHEDLVDEGQTSDMDDDGNGLCFD